MAEPNRWLHVRAPEPFTDADFDRFAAGCDIWRRYVEATLAVWNRLGNDYDAPRYEFFAPTLSEDRRVATLPVGGAWTLGSRAIFEDAGSRLLWQHFPLAFVRDGEEGLTESIDGRPVTHWRPLARPAGWRPEGALDADDVEAIVEAHHHPDRLSSVKRALSWVGEILPRT